MINLTQYVVLQQSGQFIITTYAKTSAEAALEVDVYSKYVSHISYGMPNWMTIPKWDRIMRMNGNDYSKSLEFAKTVDLIMFCMDMKGDNK